MDELITFFRARLDEAERTVYEEGSPPNGVIAWLTYRQPDGSMGYTTVAHGDSEDSAWIADGKELPEPASVLVVYDPLQALRDIDADRKLLAAYAEVAHLDTGEAEPEYAYGRAEGLGEAARLRVARFSGHAGYRPHFAPRVLD